MNPLTKFQKQIDSLNHKLCCATGGSGGVTSNLLSLNGTELCSEVNSLESCVDLTPLFVNAPIIVDTTPIMGGTNQRIGFNDNGTYGESSNLIYNDISHTLSVGTQTTSTNGTLILGGSGTGVGLLTGGGGALTIQGGPLTIDSTGTYTMKTGGVTRMSISDTGAITFDGLNLDIDNIAGGTLSIGNFSTSGVLRINKDAIGEYAQITTSDAFTGVQTFLLPSTSGTIPVSVNGQTADTAGEITLNLANVTAAGATTSSALSAGSITGNPGANAVNFSVQVGNISGGAAGMQWGYNRITTTNATPTNIRTIATSGTPVGKIYIVESWVTAIRTAGGGVVGDRAIYKYISTFQNFGGTLTKVGTDIVVLSDESVAAYDLQVVATGTTIEVKVTGVAATTIVWSAVVQVMGGVSA